MNLNDIRVRLTALGVTLRYDTDPGDIADELHAQREYRAALYIDRLEAARTFMTQTLALPIAPNTPGLGAGYAFVQNGVTSASLLDQLAADLDLWVCPAVARAIDIANPGQYIAWFTTSIFDASGVVFQANVTAFFAHYAITNHALTRIAANFQGNIATAMQRVIADQNRITLLLSDRYPGLALNALSGISSTGSDFHKGGQQVLILTFTAQSTQQPAAFPLRLIYKPADVEIDCLITGNSAAVRLATGDNAFLARSLVEIFNEYAAAHPLAGLEPLPVYRILPRNPVSRHLGGAPYPIRAAYGYIEYLSYGFEFEQSSVPNFLNFYPDGKSDYVIFRTDNEEPIIERFYRQAGQLLAVATTFSLVDLHVENVRVTGYQPHLIDLEASLTTPVATIMDTLLLYLEGTHPAGGFNGEPRNNDEYVYLFDNGPGCQPRFITKPIHNRLYVMSWSKHMVPVNAFWLLQGLTRGMNALQAIQSAGGSDDGFDDWIHRTGDVLVRVIPLKTSDWANGRFAIYADSVMVYAPPPVANLATEIAQQQAILVTDAWDKYEQAAPPPLDPRFAAIASPQAAADLDNFDIPTFYHRAGSNGLLDSLGNTVPVPAQVTVLDHGNNPVPVNTNIARATYWVAAPAPVAAQVAALTGVGFAARLSGFRDDALGVLNLIVPPTAPGKLF